MDHVEPAWSHMFADGRSVHVVVTDRRHGDLAVSQDAGVVGPRRRAIVDAPWTWLHQIHGTDVVTIDAPGGGAGSRADGACTARTGAPLAVHVADCAPIVLVSEAGGIAALHAGWRGLAGGIIGVGVAALERVCGGVAQAVVGPCIRPDSYEFGEPELSALVDQFGPRVRATSSWGAPALDLPAAVEVALGDVGIDRVSFLGGCTAAEVDARWSHRARGERERQALVAWIEEPA